MRNIILSKLASQKLYNLLEYLESNWSVKIKADFIRKFDKSLFQIQNFPDSSQHSDKEKGLHQHLVTKQTTIYYKYDNNSIKIVTIFDNRMNPKKLKKEIK